MIFLGGKAKSVAEGKKTAQQLLTGGGAKRKFLELCQHQGGALARGLPKAAHAKDVVADKDGFLQYTDVEKLGTAGIFLGAGRRFQTDQLDLSAGIEVMWANGASIRKGDPIFKLHYNSGCKIDDAIIEIRKSFSLVAQTPAPTPLIAKVLI